MAAGSNGRMLELKDLPNLRRLGQGHSGYLYETEWGGEKCARKDFPLGSDKCNKVFETEVQPLFDLNHPNIVKCLGYTLGKSSCSLLQEYVDSNLQNTIQSRIEEWRKKSSESTSTGSRVLDGDEIKRLVLSRGKKKEIALTDEDSSRCPRPTPFEGPEALSIIVQIATGMEHLHENEVVHGDLKPRNVLLYSESDKRKVKLADFGLSETKKRITLVSERSRHLETVTWKAPECLRELLDDEEEYEVGFTESKTESDKKVEIANSFCRSKSAMADVYSFGLTCSYILGGKRMRDSRPKLPSACPEHLKSIIVSCLKSDPLSRPTFSTICAALHTLPTEATEEMVRGLNTLRLLEEEPAYSSSLELPGAMATANGSSGVEYVAAQPKQSKEHTWTALGRLLRHGQPTKIEATFERLRKQSWQQFFSNIFVTIMWRINGILKLFGLVVEWTLNLLTLNHGICSLLYRLFLFRWGEIVIPEQDTENYLSLIGLLDRRTTLYTDTSKSGKADSKRADTEIFPNENNGARSTADVLIMAAKLAYENPAVIQKVVTKDWKMEFVKFYNCWNEYQQMWNTQAFVFMDKAKDANAVVVSFRGTEPFNSYDWSTDLDFSWVKLEGLGGVHLGFLEALGLATRDSIDTFVKMRNNAIATNQQMQNTEHQEAAKTPGVPPSPHHKTKKEIIQTMVTSGLPQQIIDDDDKLLAYDDITKKVALLLHDNPKAKLFITGHSLGGALATLYASMLHYTGETEVASKIGAVYTFGQPRVGDKDFAIYAAEHLAGRYFRVVYCNDLVPRVPFDDGLFAFKHFGNCDYFNSVYDGFTLDEEPNPNFFGITRLLTMHLNAVWELVQGVALIAVQHGDGFRENELGILARFAGVLLPGVAAHNPCNYVNSVRLGPLPLKERLKGDIADIAQGIHLMQDNLKDIAFIIISALPDLPGMDVVRYAVKKIFQ